MSAYATASLEGREHKFSIGDRIEWTNSYGEHIVGEVTSIRLADWHDEPWPVFYDVKCDDGGANRAWDTSAAVLSNTAPAGMLF